MDVPAVWWSGRTPEPSGIILASKEAKIIGQNGLEPGVFPQFSVPAYLLRQQLTPGFELQFRQ
jgi:hypothetical protein